MPLTDSEFTAMVNAMRAVIVTPSPDNVSGAAAVLMDGVADMGASAQAMLPSEAPLIADVEASVDDKIKALEATVTSWGPIVQSLASVAEKLAASPEGHTIASVIETAAKKLLGAL